MARKDRNLASFDEVATNINKSVNVNNNKDANLNIDNNDNNKNEKDINDNNKDNVNTNINVNDNVKLDYLDKLIEGKTKKSESESVLTGIYIQKDLLQQLDRLAKKGGRGAKSRIVNEALRSIFIEKGLL